MSKMNRDDMVDFDMYPSFRSEKEEKRYHARIWWLFALLGLFMTLSLIARGFRDLYISRNWNYIEAEYESRELGKTFYYTEDNKLRYYFLPDYKILEKDGHALLFYKDDPSRLRTLPVWTYWIPYYLVFIGLCVIGFVKLCRIYGFTFHKG